MVNDRFRDDAGPQSIFHLLGSLKGKRVLVAVEQLKQR